MLRGSDIIDEHPCVADRQTAVYASGHVVDNRLRRIVQ